MKPLILCICILIIVTSCELSSSMKSSQVRQEPSTVISQPAETSTETITVFLTGNTYGSLKPCGCSGGQLGGLERRPAIFNTVPENKRLLIDTGSIIESKPIQDLQDLYKSAIIIQAFNYLNYDIVNLTEQDIEITRGSLDGSATGYISSYETDEQFSPGSQIQYELDGEHISISVVAFDPEIIPIEYISEIFPGESEQKNVNILILSNDDEDAISDISQLGVVDCIISRVQSDEPTVESEPGEKPLVCSVGRFGRYISKIEIQKEPDGELMLSFDDIPVKEEIETDEGLEQLYKIYQERVKQSGILGTNPRYPLDDGLEYIGSEACFSDSSDCHQYEYIVWMENKNHSQAYETLEQKGSQYDPECIVCHVVGYEDETGYTTAEATPHLKDVGCEYCHGPGSAHFDNPYENPTKPPIPLDQTDLCEQCHTPEHSGDFAGHEEEYLQKIIHWTEPNDISNVK